MAGDMIIVLCSATQGRHIPKSIVSSSIDSCPTLRYSTSVSNDQAQGIHSRTIEFNDPCQNSCSPGSVEEVISQVTGGNIKMSHLNTMDRSESTNQLLQPELSQALRKLEEQLSLDKDKDSFASSEEELPPFCNLNVETHNTQDETRSPKEEALQNPLDKFQQMSNGHNEDSLQYDSKLNSSCMFCCLIKLDRFGIMYLLSFVYCLWFLMS